MVTAPHIAILSRPCRGIDKHRKSTQVGAFSMLAGRLGLEPFDTLTLLDQITISKFTKTTRLVRYKIL